jgi:hypothetical protein
MSSTVERLQKLAYMYDANVQTSRPVYELDDEELQRRTAYEKGERGLRTGLGAGLGTLAGAAHGAMIPASGKLSGKGAAVGALLGGALGGGAGYLGSKLQGMEAERELSRRLRSANKTAAAKDDKGDLPLKALGGAAAGAAAGEAYGRISGADVTRTDLRGTLKMMGTKSKDLPKPVRKELREAARTGSKIYARANRTRNLGVGAALGALGGAALHASKKKRSEKKASIAEYSVLFDKAASGDIGEHARQALQGICSAVETPVITAEKTASVYDAGNLSEIDARKARLGQLLKR